MSGDPEAPTIIRGYHHDADVLLGFLASHQGAPDRVLRLLPKTFLEVLRVCVYEEFFVHPLLRAAGRGDERPADALLERLRQIEQTLKVLERLPLEDAGFQPAVAQLIDQFRQHGRATEADMAELTRRSRGEPVDDEMGDRLTATELSGPTHSHPYDRLHEGDAWPRPGLTDELREALVLEVRSHEPEAGPSAR